MRRRRGPRWPSFAIVKPWSAGVYAAGGATPAPPATCTDPQGRCRPGLLGCIHGGGGETTPTEQGKRPPVRRFPSPVPRRQVVCPSSRPSTMPGRTSWRQSSPPVAVCTPRDARRIPMEIVVPHTGGILWPAPHAVRGFHRTEGNSPRQGRAASQRDGPVPGRYSRRRWKRFRRARGAG